MGRTSCTIAVLWALMTGGGYALAGETYASPLLAPHRGDGWSAGSRHTVRWPRDRENEGRVTARLSTDEGRTWSEIATSHSNSGELAWTVPNTVSPHCRLEVAVEGQARALFRTAFAITASQDVEYEWKPVTLKAEFAPRDGAGALSYKGRMWLLGGWNPGDKAHFPRICNNEVWSSADGKTWRLDKPNTFLDRQFDPASDWEGRHTAGYAVLNDKMWIVGGDVNQGHYHDDVWSSTDGKRWSLVNKDHPAPWGPRALHHTVAHRDKLWVIGGQTLPQFAPGKEIFHRDVWNSADGLNWERVAMPGPVWPQRGMIGGAAVFRGRIWILGGGTYETAGRPDRQFYNDVWSSADGATWKEHTPAAPWFPRQYHDVAVYDDRLWVLEGYNKAGGNRKDVWHSSDGENWYEVPNTPWAPRHAASAFVHDGSLWMVAGNNMTPDVWRLQRKGRPGGTSR